MTSAKISVTLMAINDAVNIDKCLTAVKDFADEIIVGIDDLTTDDSFKVAKKFTDKVYILPHQDNFHINKKIINAKAKSSWVLSIDSDEFVTKQLADSIKDLIAGKSFGYSSWGAPLKAKLHQFLPFAFKPPQPLTSPAAAYYLPRKNFFLDRYLKHGGQYPDPITRVFQRQLAYWPGKDVHEQMVVKGNIGWLTGDLDHYATPKFNRYLTRENRYSSLAAADLKAAGVKITFLNTLNYLFLKPLLTFSSLYFRYRGFLDGFPGFVFALFSGLHHALSYMKLWEIYERK